MLRTNKNVLTSVLLNHGVNYPTPINLSYMWGFGSLAGICLVIQIISGVFLAMHYIPTADLAFFSVEHIMRDIPNGWFIRYVHANGASFFFLFTYIHIGRGLYYSSFTYPRHFTWISGLIVFILMMATAFLGYVLPWGQMSFWAATVITNLFSAIPVLGNPIVSWLWGFYAVDSPTLHRFYSLHFLLPFIIVAAVLLHLALLHKNGSNNPLGVDSSTDTISFTPFFVYKDLVGFELFLLIFSFFIFFSPNTLGHPDNYIYADSLSTPAHIVPEWYFLPFYAILRSVPDKLGGVICMGLAIAILFALPVLFKNKIRTATFNPLYKIFTWLFSINIIFLGWLGQKPIEAPYQTLGLIASVFYFAYFIILPILL
jgi:ubiquinol-cytochrome c reductase cytochrome b subunit